MKWTWRDIDEIAVDLAERHPTLDPLSLSLQDVKTLVLGLTTFNDEPDAVTQSILESIQAAWYDEFED